MRLVWCLVPALLWGQADWRYYRGNREQTAYSTLRQIDTKNVTRLAPAWTFDTGDASAGSEIQCNPLVIGGVLYATTPKLHVFALDAATGKLKWRFDPSDGQGGNAKFRNRGLVYAQGRIYVTWRHWLMAIDAATGKRVESFGKGGRVDLRQGLGRDPETISLSVTTPGVVYRDVLILGSLVPESLPSSPGDIRAFDLNTGAQRWTFHTLPHPGEPGYETWPKEAWTYAGGTNSWAGLALDEKRGMVFVPTGSGSYDFYGANRHGDNLYANSLVALEAATGKHVWHFQFVKHDVWDRDLPSPPTLVTVKRKGKSIDAVAQITKSGHVWVLDRVTGKPLFPVETRKVPASDVEGEKLAAEQVLPLAPPPFARQEVTEENLTRRTPEAHRMVLERFRKVRSGPQFTPPSKQGTIVFPGFDGGGEWGGAAFDAKAGLLYVNANEMPWILRLVPKPAGVSGKTLYTRNCAGCHREDRGGSPPEFPSLLGLHEEKRAEFEKVIDKGQGRMPGFAHLPVEQRRAMLDYILTGVDRGGLAAAGKSPVELAYTTDGYNKFLDPEGYPAVAPPWGTLNAIDLNAGTIRWKVPFGEYPQLADKTTGSENYGGPLVTDGGVLFIGATNFDRKFRAYDKATGKVLWEAELTAGGNATPATYMAGGKQYVVIAAGGGKSGAPSGGKYHAFALP